ncbi:hypothetical protein [Culicoidibacter larvae]|uniref:Uncharacterized protein n=1 Tax=Culicoidibacter larvae TaxID=2579976 RepID=A0A5R8QH65_9FIRM|nr:hypothetical protein [Culicoidibacter larvae]TLG76607.1 hypothetical protein FEZ08_03030 [Culicoidibacter larvae]
MAEIHIHRNNSFVSSGSAFIIKLDNVEEHRILNGQKIVIDVEAGTHLVQIATFGISSAQKQFTVSEEQPLYLSTGVNLWATFALYIASLLTVFSVAPFILLFGSQQLFLWLVFIVLLIAGIFFSLRKNHYYLRQIDEVEYKRL